MRKKMKDQELQFIGKPNAGKSSLINKLLGEDRLIVSDIAGTTRDAIDTTVKRNGKEYVFIDTAGLQKESQSQRRYRTLQCDPYGCSM